MRSNLSLADARDLEFTVLVERTESILSEFDKPEVETQGEKLARLNQTLDEMPQVYRWFLQLFSFCDHWTDANAEMFGMKDRNYKMMRQRRDLFERMSKAAKIRYDGASRIITVMSDFDPTGMPRQRRGPD